MMHARRENPSRPQDLRAYGAWVFDLDNTLYPAHLTVFDAIGHRMTAFVMRETGLPHAQALALQERYHDDYGATVVGLARHHGVDPLAFIDDVHDVDLSEIAPDARLMHALENFAGRSIVFTNGARSYATRVLQRLGITDLIDGLVAIDDVDFIPKPEALSFVRMMHLSHIDAHDAVMFEDNARNADAAGRLGFATVLVGAAKPLHRVDFHTPDLHAFLEEVMAP